MQAGARASLKALGLALPLSGAGPVAALACALAPSFLLTMPTDYYLIGAGGAVLLTALVAAITPRMPQPLAPVTLMRFGYEGIGLSQLSFVVMVLLGLIGAFGARDPMHNLLSLVFWTGIWVLLPMLSVLLGNLWGLINPWRGPVRLLRQVLGWQGRVGLSQLRAWPAVLGLAGFFWFTLVSLAPEDPRGLAQVLALYYSVILLLAVAEGEDWLQEGEFLTLYFAMIAKVAPLWRQGDGRVMLGPFGAQLRQVRPLHLSEMAFITLALAGLSFDGFSATFTWLAWIGENPLEFTGRSAVMGVNSLGLLASWAVTAGLIWGALVLGRRWSGTRAMPPNGYGAVMLSFLPIAAGYHGAHHLVVLLSSGQYLLAALNDPLFRGDALLGLSVYFVSMGFLADPDAVFWLWNLQFLMILSAHLLAVLLVARLGEGWLKGWGHLPLAVLMVLYTVFGLWMLATPAGI